MNECTQKIGLFGGTFDPPHDGHLQVATAAYEQLQLDEVRWLPVGNPTHKARPDMSDVHHRINMVNIAIAGDARFTLDRTDADRPPPHYTATLLPFIQAQCPTAALWLIIGGDSLRDFHKWVEPNVILSHCRLAVYARPGAEIDWDALGHIRDLREKVDVLVGHEAAVSSTALRGVVKKRQFSPHFVPSVRAYIEKNRLYL